MVLNTHEWQELQNALATVTRLQRKMAQKPLPAEPKFGSVVKYVHRFENNDRAYHYMAGRGPNGLWYVTQDGKKALTKYPPLTWRQIVDMADEGTIYVARSWDWIG